MAQPTAEVRDARRRLRALRLAMPARERAAAERAICAALRSLRILRRGRRIAVYLAMRGEASLEGVIEEGWRRRALLYAPTVSSRRRRAMSFARLAKDLPVRHGSFGIAEPVTSAAARLPALRLDVVLVPVVGFDADGNRLGMGAGFYDRALRGRRRPGREWRRPRLIGIAFACQQLPRIEPSPWDVPLDLIVTERGVVRPARRSTDRHPGRTA